MPEFRFIHSSDLHLGRRFGGMPEETRGRLVEARHQIVGSLARAARTHAAQHILVAGDIFDSETPSDQVWRQALAAMTADSALHWWLIPGNHDSLAAESLWQRFRAHAAANVHLIGDAEPVEIAAGVVLLPAPAPSRYPGRDLTQWMESCATEPGVLRIGLAHGAVQGFGEDDSAAAKIVPPDRAGTARLDYLALGDWHGHQQIGERTWYSGTPERDSFRHNGRGACLAVSIAAAGAPPNVEVVETGALTWRAQDLSLLAAQDGAGALAATLPTDRSARRDHLLRFKATGRATLAGRATLHDAADAVAPEFCFFALDDIALQTEFEAADLDAIDRNGALRLAAESLSDAAQDETRTADARQVSAAALNRLYGYLKGERA